MGKTSSEQLKGYQFKLYKIVEGISIGTMLPDWVAKIEKFRQEIDISLAELIEEERALCNEE